MKKYRVVVNGVSYEVELEALESASSAVQEKPVVERPSQPVQPSQNGGEVIKAPMPGTILDVKVQSGQSVKAGDILFILEAMKMENEILAPVGGTVSSLSVTKGQSVETGANLCAIA